MEDDKVDIGRNGSNIPISPTTIPISSEDATMTPLQVKSDDDENFVVKNSNNKNIKLLSSAAATSKKDNIKNLEDDIKEIFGERSSSGSEKIIPKSSKIKNQRKSSIGSTGSSGGGGGSGSSKSLNKNIAAGKSPTRNQQKNSPNLLKSIKSEMSTSAEPSTSNINNSSIGKRCYNEINKFLSTTTTLPNENEYLYGFDENGVPVYGPSAKKIKGENIDDDDDNTANDDDDIQLNNNVKNPLVIIENPPEMNEKIYDNEIIIKSPNSSNTEIETENIAAEEEATSEQNDSKDDNEKDDIIDNQIKETTPPPSATTTESLSTVITPASIIQTNNTSISKMKPSEDPIYRKPFEMGWKREIVLRALPGSKDKGEVYYITPNGKKLRTRNEIQSHLTIGLTLDNFTFSKDPLGAGPDEEIIRSAKITGRTSTDIILGKRIPKPKAPKGASPPPQQQQSSSSTTHSWSNKSSSKSTTDRHSHHHHHNSSSASSSPRIISNTRISEDNSGIGTKVNTKISSSKSNKKGEPCTIQCLPAIGMIPQLQCTKCLCLYHHECVGLDRYNNDYQLNLPIGGGSIVQTNFGNNDINRNNNTKIYQKDYECASCKNQSSTSNSLTKLIVLPETNNFIKNITSTTTTTNNPNNPDKYVSNINIRNTKNTKFNSQQIKSNENSGSGGETNNNNNNNNPQQQPNPFINSSNNDLNIEKSSTMPQSIAVLNGRKYLVIRKPGLPSVGVEQQDSASSTGGTGDSLSSSVKKRTSSVNQSSGGGTSTSNAPVKIQKIDTFANNFFGNVSLGYDVLLEIFQYLKVQELLRAACVCRVWNVVANHRSLWKTVRMKNSQINDWSGLAASLRRNETQHLDLRKMLCLNTSEDQMWSNFAEHIKSVITLQKIDLGRCSAQVVQNLFLTTPQLRYLNAISIRSDTLNLQNLNLMKNLEELRLKTNDGCNLDGDLKPLELLTNLRHLSLTSINELGLKNINILGNLINLESLEIGECSHINSEFAVQILPKLIKLERLRLEKSTETHITFELLKTISQMKNLLQLELVNFDIRDGFESKIIECKYLKRLLLIPTYISQSATTNQIILSSMRKLTTLDSLTWVVTMELLRVTALYVDQCEDVTKGKKTFDESIPVLKPVPGTNYNDDNDNINKQTTEVQQVEILPLSKIKEILDDGMPNTKFKIVKVAFHATWRQNYVE